MKAHKNSKLFIQDGDSLQKSALARAALKIAGAELQQIPGA